MHKNTRSHHAIADAATSVRLRAGVKRRHEQQLDNSDQQSYHHHTLCTSNSFTDNTTNNSSSKASSSKLNNTSSQASEKSGSSKRRKKMANKNSSSPSTEGDYKLVQHEVWWSCQLYFDLLCYDASTPVLLLRLRRVYCCIRLNYLDKGQCSGGALVVLCLCSAALMPQFRSDARFTTVYVLIDGCVLWNRNISTACVLTFN